MANPAILIWAARVFWVAALACFAVGMWGEASSLNAVPILVLAYLMLIARLRRARTEPTTTAL